MPQLDFDGANSKISADKIQGQSGTTVTIPAGHNLAGDGSGLTSLPAANLTGTLPAIDGSNLTGVSGGKVLQVLQTVKTDTATIASTTYADILGLSQAITPSATSSKILVSAQLSISSVSGVGGHFRFMRDTTAIGIGDAAGSRTRATWGSRDIVNPSESKNVFIQFLDSPSSTSSTTYKIQWRCQNASYAQWIGRTSDDSDNATYGRYMTNITVMEIGA